MQRCGAFTFDARHAPSASQLAGSLPELGSWDEAHSKLLTRSPGADGEYAASFDVAVSGSCPTWPGCVGRGRPWSPNPGRACAALAKHVLIYELCSKEARSEVLLTRQVQRLLPPSAPSRRPREPAALRVQGCRTRSWVLRVALAARSEPPRDARAGRRAPAPHRAPLRRTRRNQDDRPGRRAREAVAHAGGAAAGPPTLPPFRLSAGPVPRGAPRSPPLALLSIRRGARTHRGARRRPRRVHARVAPLWLQPRHRREAGAGGWGRLHTRLLPSHSCAPSHQPVTGAAGIWYREWAPGASSACLVGDFNGWSVGATPCTRGDFGEFAAFLPDGPGGRPAIAHRSIVKVSGGEAGGREVVAMGGRLTLLPPPPSPSLPPHRQVSFELPSGERVFRLPAWTRQAVYDAKANEYTAM